MSSVLIQQGQVWEVKVHFIDHAEQWKYRPAMIIGWANLHGHRSDKPTLLLVPITSFGDGGQPIRGDVPISTPEVDLKRGSYARAFRPFTMHAKLLAPCKLYGTVSSSEFGSVKACIQEILEPDGLGRINF